MMRDVPSGILLIAGSAAFMLVMILHPTGHDITAGVDAPRMARVSMFVHGLALATAPLLLLGWIGFSRRLGFDGLVTAALVVYAFGVVAVMQAAVASGFVATPLLDQMREAEGGTRDVLHALAAYTFRSNQVFAMIHELAFAAAMLLWSAAILRRPERLPLAVPTALLGIVVAAGTLLSLAGGYLRLDVHGMLILTAAKSLWMIWIGILLVRAGGRVPGPDPARAGASA